MIGPVLLFRIFLGHFLGILLLARMDWMRWGGCWQHMPATTLLLAIVRYCDCLFFLGMTCDDALELPHTIEGALCRQTLLFLFKVCIPTHVIPTLVKIHLNPSGNYISALVKMKLNAFCGTIKCMTLVPVLLLWVPSNLSGLQICGWCRPWTFLPLFFYYLCRRRMLSGACASLKIKFFKYAFFMGGSWEKLQSHYLNLLTLKDSGCVWWFVPIPNNNILVGLWYWIHI